MMYRLYGVTRAGYYAWRRHTPGVRAREDAVLASRIARVHAASRALYGSPRVHRQLQRQGVRVGENRVARLIRHHGIRARVATLHYTVPAMKRFFADIPNRQHDHPVSSACLTWPMEVSSRPAKACSSSLLTGVKTMFVSRYGDRRFPGSKS